MSEQPVQDESLRGQVSMFLRRNFPQIQMHGGSASVVSVDAEKGTVEIQLSGACSGCGISPMTVQAIKRRMREEIDAVESVNAAAGELPETDNGTSSFDVEDAPF